MKTAQRFHWLRPRFSLGNLLMLMVVVGLCLAWYDQRRKLGEQAEMIERQRLEITRLAVDNILRSDMTEEEKAAALRPIIKVGDASTAIEEWYGSPSQTTQFEKSIQTTYYAGDLVVRCIDGSVSEFGYYTQLQYKDDRSGVADWVRYVLLSAIDANEVPQHRSAP